MREVVKAYRVEPRGCPELAGIYTAASAGKARYKSYLRAQEAGFGYGFADLVVRRAPEYDGLGLDGKNLEYAELERHSHVTATAQEGTMGEPMHRLPQLGANALADRIRDAIGAGHWEEVIVSFPQVDRTDGNEPWWFPKSAADLDAIKDAPATFLRRLGCGLWGPGPTRIEGRRADDEATELWLYPAEWYDHIPDGYEIVDICGEREPFKRGVTDDDRRFGCLAYGFSRPAQETEA